MQIVGFLNGKNKNYDYQLSAASLALLTGGVVGSGLGVTDGEVAAGTAFVECVRTNGQRVLVHYENTAALVFDTTGTKKVFVLIDQEKIDNGSANAADGTGIGAVSSAADWPSANFVPLATIDSGVVTDAREYVRMRGMEVSGPVGLDKSEALASAAILDLGTATGNLVHITGTTGISSFGTSAQAGAQFVVVFDGALTLTHSSSIVLPGAADVTTSAGDSGIFVYEGSGAWRCTSYVKAN